MTAVITNLHSMQGMGIFADRNAKMASLGLLKYNLVYGFNGSGKSTLSRIFASLQDGATHKRLPVGNSFEVCTDSGGKFGCPEKPSGLEKRVVVFNGDFIEKNLQWTEGRAKPIFFLGADQKEAAAELEVLEAKLATLKMREPAAITVATKADKALQTFKRDRAKVSAGRLHLGNRKYEAPELNTDYLAWAGDDFPSLTDDELKAAEDTRRLSEPLPKIEPIVFDIEAIGKGYAFVTDMCVQTISTVALAEVQRFPDMLLWLKQGNEFHEANKVEDCLLCGNAISKERRDLLAAALDGKIDQFIGRLDKTGERLNGLIAELKTLEQSLPLTDAFQMELRAGYKEARADLVAKIRSSYDHLIDLKNVLGEKRERPASAANLSRIASQDDVVAAAKGLDGALTTVNTMVVSHEIIRSQYEEHRDKAELAIRKHFIAECREAFAEHLKALDDAKEELKAITDDKEASATAAEGLRQQIRQHGPAADVINKLIASYLGHDELTIVPIDEGYELHRHGNTIEGMPSEGEKTAIAIAYFLSTIEADGKQLKDLIVVVDDPVSSLDTKALNYACSLLRSKLDGVAQLIILTHNQQCMNEFNKAWKRKTKADGDKPATARLLFIDVTIPEGQTKRVSTIVEMSPLLREYDSEYHFLFSHVLKFVANGEKYHEYAYMIPNVLRRVLDIFLAFKCPGSSGLADKILQICRAYPDLDSTRLVALDRLVQVESHSDNLEDLISFSSMTLEESRAAAKTLLDMMKHVDEKHLTALTRICV